MRKVAWARTAVSSLLAVFNAVCSLSGRKMTRGDLNIRISGGPACEFL